MPDRPPHRTETSSRAILVAFVASGAIWISGFTVAMRGIGLPLLLAVAAYVTICSLLLASNRLRTGPALVTVWVVAVILLTALINTGDAGFWMSLYGGTLGGSLLFTPWCVTGFLLLHVFTGGPHGGPAPVDER